MAPRVDDLVAADAPHLAPEAARAVEAAAAVARPVEAQPGRDGLVAVIPVAAVSAVEQLNQVYILGSCYTRYGLEGTGNEKIISLLKHQMEQYGTIGGKIRGKIVLH